MGNKRNRRSRRLETPSPDRELSEAQVETPMQGNGTLTNVSTVIQEPLGENENRSNLIDLARSVTRSKFGQKTLNKRTMTG